MFKALNQMYKTIAVYGLMWFGFSYFWAKLSEVSTEFKARYLKK